MQLQVKGKNVPVTDALFDHAERKLQRLTKILPPWDEPPIVELELSVERNPKIAKPHTAEITVRTRGGVLRAHESAEDMYTAIDKSAHKLERQAARYRERRRSHRAPHEHAPEPVSTVAPELQHEAEAEGPRVVKTKQFALKPMSSEEAALHMDMLHHDFYVFRSADTGDVNVVYRRRDGDVGLIVPDLA